VSNNIELLAVNILVLPLVLLLLVFMYQWTCAI
jgi:hypothetical protein